MRLSKKLENKISSYVWNFKFIGLQNQIIEILYLNRIEIGSTLLAVWGVTEMLCYFKFLLKRKFIKWITKLSRLAFPEPMLANHFSFLDTKTNYILGVPDLALLIVLLSVCKNSWKSIFWEAINSFVILT